MAIVRVFTEPPKERGNAQLRFLLPHARANHTARRPNGSDAEQRCNHCAPWRSDASSISRASSTSAAVTPPAEWVVSVNVNVRHRMSISGWWSMVSATKATSSTSLMAVRKSGPVTVREIA
jgi:hypothetical protein